MGGVEIDRGGRLAFDAWPPTLFAIGPGRGSFSGASPAAEEGAKPDEINFCRSTGAGRDPRDAKRHRQQRALTFQPVQFGKVSFEGRPDGTSCHGLRISRCKDAGNANHVGADRPVGFAFEHDRKVACHTP